MQKPLISAAAEMGGFVLVEAPAPSPGEHKCSGTHPFGLRLRDQRSLTMGFYFAEIFGEVP